MAMFILLVTGRKGRDSDVANEIETKIRHSQKLKLAIFLWRYWELASSRIQIQVAGEI